MKSTFGWKSLLALVAALAIVVSASTSVSAERGKPAPGRGRQPVALAGVISAIATNDQGSLITLDRKDKDSVKVQVMVQVTSDTRIVPAGATPEVGDHAVVVAEKPANEGDPLVAKVLNLAKRALPGVPKEKAVLHVCGTITVLPIDDPHDGTWTVTVATTATPYDLIVTADTEITPKDATPAVGGAVCAEARQTDAGWLALKIHLTQVKPGEGKGEHKAIVIRGKIVDPLPDNRSGDWTLVVAVEGAANQSILVTKDTKIEGELAVDALVVVVAKKTTDAAGVETLVAEAIKIVPVTPREPKVKDIVRVKGVVTKATADAWTIAPKDGADIVVGISAATKIVGLPKGEVPATGRKVEGLAVRATDGSLVAWLLRVEKD
jgi:hypothetical protein